MNYCPDCGCKMYNGACTNCDEELFIIDQYAELGTDLPSDDTYFMKQAKSSMEKIKNNKNKL